MSKGQSKYPWEEIRACHAAGMTLTSIAETFKIPIGTILSKSHKEQWGKKLELIRKSTKKTLSTIQEQNIAEGKSSRLAPKSAQEAIISDWIKKGDTHKGRMHEIIQRLTEQVEANPPEVETVKDLKDLNEIAMKVYGIEEKNSKPNQNCLVNLQFLTTEKPIIRTQAGNQVQ